MSIHKVNTDAIASAAGRISRADTAINDAFFRTVKEASAMSGFWNSRAGDAAQDLLDRLIQGNDARSAVLKSYEVMLNQVVNPGYVESEKVNTKLADLLD